MGLLGKRTLIDYLLHFRYMILLINSFSEFCFSCFQLFLFAMSTEQLVSRYNITTNNICLLFFYTLFRRSFSYSKYRLNVSIDEQIFPCRDFNYLKLWEKMSPDDSEDETVRFHFKKYTFDIRSLYIASCIFFSSNLQQSVTLR